MRRVLLALIVAACGSESHGNLAEAPRPAIPVQVVTAAPTDLPRVLSAVGTLSSSETTVVSAEITGTVRENTQRLDLPPSGPSSLLVISGIQGELETFIALGQVNRPL